MARRKINGNRFNTAPGVFQATTDGRMTPDGGTVCYSDGSCVQTGTFCDPQVGCSDRLVAEDLSAEHAWQLSQEFRLASNFSGPFNFSAGGNYLHSRNGRRLLCLLQFPSLRFSPDRERPADIKGAAPPGCRAFLIIHHASMAGLNSRILRPRTALVHAAISIPIRSIR